MLLDNDLNKELLINELHIKKLHANLIMKEIDKFRDANKSFKQWLSDLFESLSLSFGNGDSNKNNSNPNTSNIDFDKIVHNLESQKIIGKYLISLNRNDLHRLGFNLFEYQKKISKSIKKLVAKYPMPIESDSSDNDSNSNNDYPVSRSQMEGMIYT